MHGALSKSVNSNRGSLPATQRWDWRYAASVLGSAFLVVFLIVCIVKGV